MESIYRMMKEYNRYCLGMHNEIENLKVKMNQDFDASIRNFDPKVEKCLHTLEYYKTKELLNEKSLQFKKECRLWK
jgi:hypothetical protein